MECNCPKCGAVVNPKAMFCEFCGNKLAHEEHDYNAETQYELFYNSCAELNLDNPKQIHTYWWLMVLSYIFIDFATLLFFANDEGFIKALCVEHILLYFVAQLFFDTVINKYVGKIIFPKASDTVYNTIAFIEKQLEKNSKKEMLRLRNCMRHEAWLLCLTSIQQRPSITDEANRRIDGLKRLYTSKRFVICLLCVGVNAFFVTLLLIADCLYSL